MGDYVTLIGAEDVRNAGHRIAEAAQQMSGAASYMDDALRQNRIWMDEWLARFEAAVEKLAAPRVFTPGPRAVKSTAQGVRNHRVEVIEVGSGCYAAACLADYEDLKWGTDVVTTGMGRYKDRNAAVDEAETWAAAEGWPCAASRS